MQRLVHKITLPRQFRDFIPSVASLDKIVNGFENLACDPFFRKLRSSRETLWLREASLAGTGGPIDELTGAMALETIPLERVWLLNLSGEKTKLKQHTGNFLLLIFLRHLA